ncbi:dTMP kinase [Thermodesulfobacteriota bacterium]
MNKEHNQPNQNGAQDQDRKEPILVSGGLFVVFEGIDGTGKSTQLHMLAEKLEQLGYAVVPTCEPTDGTYGKKIRELFVDRKSVSQGEELELFIADREQHVQEVIAPALKDGRIVVCDRYYLSTLAYQGANGIDPDLIMDKNKDFPVPDLAIILEIDPALGIRRIRNQRNESPDTFEGESNLRKVAAIFSSMQHPYIERINGSDTIENIHRQVVNAVTEKLSHKRVRSINN